MKMMDTARRAPLATMTNWPMKPAAFCQHTTRSPKSSRSERADVGQGRLELGRILQDDGRVEHHAALDLLWVVDPLE